MRSLSIEASKPIIEDRSCITFVYLFGPITKRGSARQFNGICFHAVSVSEQQRRGRGQSALGRMDVSAEDAYLIDYS